MSSIEGKGWMDARNLQAGDRSPTADGRVLTIANLSIDARYDTVYNFEVEGNHTYYAGARAVLVHNQTGTGCTPSRGYNNNAPNSGRGRGAAFQSRQQARTINRQAERFDKEMGPQLTRLGQLKGEGPLSAFFENELAGAQSQIEKFQQSNPSISREDFIESHTEALQSIEYRIYAQQYEYMCMSGPNNDGCTLPQYLLFGWVQKREWEKRRDYLDESSSRYTRQILRGEMTAGELYAILRAQIGAENMCAAGSRCPRPPDALEAAYIYIRTRRAVVRAMR